jgi:hypothetical protein
MIHRRGFSTLVLFIVVVKHTLATSELATLFFSSFVAPLAVVDGPLLWEHNEMSSISIMILRNVNEVSVLLLE